MFSHSGEMFFKPTFKYSMLLKAEIMSIPGSDERWENWMQFVQVLESIYVIEQYFVF